MLAITLISSFFYVKIVRLAEKRCLSDEKTITLTILTIMAFNTYFTSKQLIDVIYAYLI